MRPPHQWETTPSMYNPINRFKRILAELQLNGRHALTALRHTDQRMAALEAGMNGLREELLVLPLTALRHMDQRMAALEASMNRLGEELLTRPPKVAGGQGGGNPVSDIGGLGLGIVEARTRILKLAALLAPQRAVGVAKVRVGGANDGGYIMLDDWSGIVGAVSIGIGGDDAWDRAALGHGVPVAQYDHTITEPPSRAEGLHWQKIGLGETDANVLQTLHSLIALSGLPGEGDLILKLDAEGAEWAALAAGEAIAPLGRFRQIVIELHGFGLANLEGWHRTAATALAHLDRTHAVVHVHANNHGGMILIGGIPFPRVLEITYARRDAYNFIPDEGPFPEPLDAACNPAVPDLYLGSFRFPAPSSSA